MDDPGNPGFLTQPAASIRYYALLATRRPRATAGSADLTAIKSLA